MCLTFVKKNNIICLTIIKRQKKKKMHVMSLILNIQIVDIAWLRFSFLLQLNMLQDKDYFVTFKEHLFK